MIRQPRLSRSQVLEGLRAHSARHGFVSGASLHAHDRNLQRSISLWFVGLDAARYAARVPGPPPAKGGAKRGPKPGTKMPPRARTWNKQRVLRELRRLHRQGHSTRLDDLIEGGFTTLVNRATVELGGLTRARDEAGIAQPRRRGGKPKREDWTRETVLRAIRSRQRKRQSLASSRVPQSLYRGARYHFGSWPAALEALGISPDAVRAYQRKYTRAEIIRRLHLAARNGSNLRQTSLKSVVGADAIRREFGTLAKAISAAGLDAHLTNRVHGGKKWSRERVIAVLRERARRGEHTLTSHLYVLVRQYFGSADAARVAAGVPSPIDLRMEAHNRGRATSLMSSNRQRPRAEPRQAQPSKQRDRTDRPRGSANIGRR